MPAMKYLKKIITCVLTITLIIICGCQDNNTPSNPSKATTDAEYESAMHIAETTPLEGIRNSSPIPWESCPVQIIQISHREKRMKITHTHRY
ncbi:MAG: hypothetical protein ACLTDF_00725 [Coprococcus sp.]